MIVSPGANHATGCGRAILWRRHSLGSGTGKENIHKGGSVVARRRKESGRSKKEKRGGIERRRRRRREAPTARTSRSFLYLGGVCVRISLLPHLLALRDLQVNSTREKVKILFNPDGWTGRIDGFALIKTKAEPNKSRIGLLVPLNFSVISFSDVATIQILLFSLSLSQSAPALGRSVTAENVAIARYQRVRLGIEQCLPRRPGDLHT